MLIITDRQPLSDIESVLTPDEIAAIQACEHHYPDPRAAVIDALKVVQARFGWVNDKQVVAIAQLLRLTVPDVEGVATFYNRIYRLPVGRHVISLCDSVACYLVGAEPLAAAVQRELGIGFGQTTADGRFTLLPICCLGDCDHAPAILIDDDTYGPVTPANLPALLSHYL